MLTRKQDPRQSSNEPEAGPTISSPRLGRRESKDHAFIKERFRLSNCYCSQDLPWVDALLQARAEEGSAQPAQTFLHVAHVCALGVPFSRGLFEGPRNGRQSEFTASASSIFGAVHLDRWVVTHSLADTNLHGHRPVLRSRRRPSEVLWMSGGRSDSSCLCYRFSPHRQYCLPVVAHLGSAGF